jgi:uncharacterized membrane protein
MFHPENTDIRRLSASEKWIVGFSALGAAFMAYLFTLHFEGASSSLCNFGAGFSCQIVNQSIYSVLGPIPVSVFGFLYFASAIAAILLRAKRAHEFLALVTAGALVFSAYLSFVEARVLYTFCLFCEASKLLMVAILIHCERHLRGLGARVTASSYAAAVGAGLVFTLIAGQLQQ